MTPCNDNDESPCDYEFHRPLNQESLPPIGYRRAVRNPYKMSGGQLLLLGIILVGLLTIAFGYPDLRPFIGLPACPGGTGC
jgi:hypothetical protein